MLTREQVKAALEEVGAAAKEIGKKYGLDVVGNTASFSSHEATTKSNFLFGTFPKTEQIPHRQSGTVL